MAMCGGQLINATFSIFKIKETKFDKPLRRFSELASLRFYNAEIHTAAFAFPQFLKKV
jgi:spermidine synthase